MSRARATVLPVVSAVAATALLLAGCGPRADDARQPDRAAPAAQERETGQSEQAEPSQQPGAEPATRDDAESVAPADRVLMEYGQTSEQVRELQARLTQTGHFAAQPTGYYGDVTLGAVSEYQRDAGLKVSGTVRESTWQALTGETTEPARDELYPPRPVMDYGQNSEQVRELQARLTQAGHFTHAPTGYYGDVTTAAVSAYQRAAGLEATGTVYEDTWTALTGETRQPTREEMYPPLDVPEAEPAQVLDERCLTGRVLCISKTSSTLSWVIGGDVRMTMDVRFGAEETPTREGTFEVYWKSRHHHSTIYDSPMPYAMFFDGGQAVHYSEDFAANGYNGASHGCVNVRDESAIASLYDQVRVGDKVVVYW